MDNLLRSHIRSLLPLLLFYIFGVFEWKEDSILIRNQSSVSIFLSFVNVTKNTLKRLYFERVPQIYTLHYNKNPFTRALLIRLCQLLKYCEHPLESTVPGALYALFLIFTTFITFNFFILLLNICSCKEILHLI